MNKNDQRLESVAGRVGEHHIEKPSSTIKRKIDWLRGVADIRRTSVCALRGLRHRPKSPSSISLTIGTILLVYFSAACSADIPAQQVFSEAPIPPVNSYLFLSGQAGCAFIAKKLTSQDPAHGYTYSNPLYVANDPQWGTYCQYTLVDHVSGNTYTEIAQNYVGPDTPICPQGYAVNWSGTTCSCNDATVCPKQKPPCECDGNPIFRGYGIKQQTETDYVGSSNSLRFERIYNNVQSASSQRIQWTRDVPLGGLGVQWLHTYSRVIDLVSNSTTTSALMYRPNGDLLVFQQNGSTWTPDADVSDTLTQTTDGSGHATGWIYHTAATDETETYNAQGLLQTIISRSGVTQTLTYSTDATASSIAPLANLLIQVTDSFGRQLNLTYDTTGRISTLIDPAGDLYIYTYNGSNQLVSVQYPDTKTRSYLYDEAAYAVGTPTGALTGITDENGQRFATFTYSGGKATSTYHAANIEQYSLSYGTNQTTVTDPLNTVRTYNFQTILGVVKGTSQSQPAGAGSSASSSSTTYDANSNVASKTDFNGNVTRTYLKTV